MSSPDILVLNLGADRQFKESMKQVTGLVTSYAFTTRNATVEAKTSRSLLRVTWLISQPIGLLHVMAQGEPDGKLHSPGPIGSPPKVFDLDVTRRWVEQTGVELKIDAVLVDACDTFTGDWQELIASILPPRRSGVMIGTTRAIGWDDAATFVGCFYPSLLRRQFPETPARRRAAVLDAHERACAAYKTLIGRKAPYAACVLTGTQT